LIPWSPTADNAGVAEASDAAARGPRTRAPWPRRAVIAAAITGYALLAARCRPLTAPALAAVLLAGVPLFWYGARRRPAAARPAGGRSAAVWLGVGGVAGAYELALRLGPDDLAHPTLSTLADPALATYPGRVVGYLVWIGLGAWLVSR
jgi:hypothetical protein